VRELNIDWPALHSAFQMNMPEVRCFLSLEDGRVLKVPPGDGKLAEVREQTSRFAPIEAVPSRIQYQWLDDFIRAVVDPAVKLRMEAAINGKGAFRRFKDILLTVPDERRRWFEFRDIKMRERIVEWVAEQGVKPANEPPWVAEGAGAAGVAGEAGAAAGDISATAVNGSGNGHATSVEALRDFLIAWSEGKGPEALTPVALENLAQSINEGFVVKAKEQH
jgi:hypothetical protein